MHLGSWLYDGPVLHDRTSYRSPAPAPALVPRSRLPYAHRPPPLLPASLRFWVHRVAIRLFRSGLGSVHIRAHTVCCSVILCRLARHPPASPSRVMVLVSVSASVRLAALVLIIQNFLSPHKVIRPLIRPLAHSHPALGHPAMWQGTDAHCIQRKKQSCLLEHKDTRYTTTISPGAQSYFGPTGRGK